MKKLRYTLCSFSLCAVILTVAASGTLVSAADDRQETIVSPSLAVISEDNSMAMAGIIGGEISFEKEDFMRALNVSRMDYVTVTSTPDVGAGELRVGQTVVSGGQRISAASLDLMRYVPSSAGSTRATFRFRPAGASYDIPCELYMLERANLAPTLDGVPENYLQVSTHKNVSLFGTLPCHDPEGDRTTVEIVSYPSQGLLEITDKHSGEYKYTPSANYSGKDSFVYVARDLYGNYSAARTVSLSVKKPSTSLTFDDMQGSPYYNAALTMAEEGIMSGSKVGSHTYFYPDGEVSRGDFVVMTLQALGLESVNSDATTVFADNADIPEHIRGYVAAAYELGYVSGVQTERGLCFEASRSITRAEAAVILSNALDLAVPTVLPTFNDSADIPAWAAPAVYSLNSIGVMSATDGNISANGSLLRKDAARILSELISYLD